MMRRRTLLSGSGGLLTPGLLAAPALAQADNRPSLTIAVQRLSNSNTFEPPREQSNVGFRIHGLYAEQLIGTDWLNNAALVPGLAASWQRVDARRLDLSLRPDVKFHDGSLLTAEDVVFSFNERLFGTQGATGAGGPRFLRVRPARSRRLRLSRLAGAPIQGLNAWRSSTGTPFASSIGHLM